MLHQFNPNDFRSDSFLTLTHFVYPFCIDKYDYCAYNVRMNAINTTLTTSGNSVAVRLPKELLKMSGLGSRVKLEAKQGKIIISKSTNVHDGWGTKIKALVAINGDPAQEFGDMKTSTLDGLENLPWDGPTFEEWRKDNAKLS
jgi:antitoxin component of MazEF toxin-antitoxin module